MDNLQTLCPHCLTANRVAADRLGEKPKCGKCHQALFTGTPLTADENQLARWLEKEQLPIVVDFWAEWCGPCKSFAPGFARAAQQLEPMARFLKVETDKAQRAAAQFGIRSIPTLMIFKGGEIAAQQSGALPYPDFIKWLHGALG